jgi:hypothetical protein
MTHVESSELTAATVTGAPASLRWTDVRVIVNGIDWTFGSAPDFAARTFSVDGKAASSAPVERGDVAKMPGAGETLVRFEDRASGSLLFGYVASIPDTTPPAAPANQNPAKGATGTPRNPTFTWGTVSDPSDVTYTLQYAIDPTFATASAPTPGASGGSTSSMNAEAGTVSSLSQPSYAMQSGTTLEPDVTYYWHVRATDGAGNVGPWSATSWFATGS